MVQKKRKILAAMFRVFQTILNGNFVQWSILLFFNWYVFKYHCKPMLINVIIKRLLLTNPVFFCNTVSKLKKREKWFLWIHIFIWLVLRVNFFHWIITNARWDFDYRLLRIIIYKKNREFFIFVNIYSTNFQIDKKCIYLYI